MNSQYKELSDKAFYCHQHGDLQTAAEIYQALLTINPDDANILNLAGMLMLTNGDIDSAIDYITKAFIINRTPQIANNLGKAYYTAGMYDKAVKLYLEALSGEENDDIYYSLGLAYKKAGNIDGAIEAYRNALEQNPGNYSSCYNLALAYSDKGDIIQAIYYAEKCTILKDDDEMLFGILSGFYEQIGNYKGAIDALKKAAAINPANFTYYYNMAVLNTMIDNLDEAVNCYFKSIELNPNHIESYVNLANILKENDTDKALEFLLKAYEIRPKEEILLLSLAQLYKNTFKNEESIKILKELFIINPMCDEAYSLMAMNLMDLCQYQQALNYYDIAIKLNPNNLDFQHGRAVALKYLGNEKECFEILKNIVENENSSLESKITLGMLYLKNKDFQKGMELYRLRSDNIKSETIDKDVIWEPNQDISNKTVLVYSNCGLGDSIMYARYLPLLKEKNIEVILQTDKEIVPIIQESFPMINVIKKTIKPPKHDIILQFMDIQLALNMDFDNIPFSNGYLKANEQAVKMYSNLPELKTTKKKIGIFRQGNKKIFKNRSIPFEIMSRLIENKNFNFYSFQMGESIKETDNFFDLTKHINDYSDTAALLKNIDILITIDSSIAHMAGALGVKTYLLLPKTSEWRWFDDEKTTPWYDSVTIFKQIESNNWNEVMDRVIKSL